MRDFVHLHVHSHYSTLDGIIRLDDLCEKTAALGMKAIALTDHGNLFGLLDFQEQAKKNALHPIFGCEFYLAQNSISEKSPKEERFHLVALAETNEGYQNLCKLSSIAYLDGFYSKPRIDKALLAEYSAGLILSSACLQGEIAFLLNTGRREQARAAAASYIDIAGKDNFYIEIMDHGIPEQKKVNRELIELAREMGIPLIATNDVHFLEREDYEASEIALCIGTADKYSNPARFKMANDNFYLKTGDEMYSIFGEIPESLTNTAELALRCQANIETVDNRPEGEKYRIPVYETPEGYSESEYLRALCEEGLKTRYAEVTPEIRERLLYEISVIEKMGFSGYFLIVWDLVDYARRNEIPVGPGRGSAAGSIVSYTLGITSIDPLKFNLFFERFLNPSRISMPDIDMDFCVEKREQVIDYIRGKYGASQVAQIVTYSYLKARAVIKDVARVLEIDFQESNKISALVPRELNISLEEALEKEPQLREFRERGGKYATLFRNAFRLENVIRGTGKHAAGVVISEKPLVEYIPLHKDSKSDQVITQYDGPHLEKVGLLKMDLLGLQNLSTIKECLRLIHVTRGEWINLEQISFDDKTTYALLQKGQSLGVFQLDSPGMQQLVRAMQPDKFDEIIALNALYRPGPLEASIPKRFCDRKFGREPIEYFLPITEEILKDTYGFMIYQEQVMKISEVVGGYTMAEADELRRAMGKKDKTKIPRMRTQFIEGARVRGIDSRKAEELFERMAAFANYGFNKSHSAAYAVITYQTAWLKANYPLEYMAALLTSQKTDADKLELYIREAQAMGIRVLPPDVNKSAVNFAVENGAIRYGLSAIKGIGELAAETIIRARGENRFTDLTEFCASIDLRTANKRVLEALIYSGAFASTGKRRSVLFGEIDAAVQNGSRMQEDAASGQGNFFDDFGGDSDSPTAKKGHTKEAGHHEALEEEWPEDKLLSLEKEFLGAYITGHPFARYARTWNKLGMVSSRNHANAQLRSKMRIGGILRAVQERLTKGGQPFGIITLEDPDGNYEILLFSKDYETFRPLLTVGTALLISVEMILPKGRDRVQMSVKNMQLLDDFVVYDLHITLRPETGNDELREIREYLLDEKHRGESSVYFHVKSEECSTVVRAGTIIRVHPSEELLSSLSALRCVQEAALR